MNKLIAVVLFLSCGIFADHFHSYTPFADYSINHGQNVILMENKQIDSLEAYQISWHLYENSMRHGIDFNFALALMYTESRFTKTAHSPAGAVGLMQILPSTAKSMSRMYEIDFTNIWDIEDNISLGMAYLRHLKMKYGNYECIAAGYNGGPVGAKKYRQYMDGKRSIYSIHKETRKYVPKVMAYFDKYRNMETDYLFRN